MNIFKRVLNKAIRLKKRITSKNYKKEKLKYHQYITDFEGTIFYNEAISAIEGGIAISSLTTPLIYIIPVLNLKQYDFIDDFKKTFPGLGPVEKPLNLSQKVKSLKSHPLSFTRIKANKKTSYDFSILAKSMFEVNPFFPEVKKDNLTIDLIDSEYIKNVMVMYNSMGFDIQEFNINNKPLPDDVHIFVNEHSIWFHHIIFSNDQNIIIPFIKNKDL